LLKESTSPSEEEVEEEEKVEEEKEISEEMKMHTFSLAISENFRSLIFYCPIAQDKSDLRKPDNLAFEGGNSVGKNTFLYKEVSAYSS
jgi:hypothetical protein